MRDTKVVIAVGATVYDNRIKQRKLTVDQLFDELSKPKIRKKKDGPYFVFASFSKDVRNASNVKYYYGATLDVDYDNVNPKYIRDVLKPLKVKYCIYTTHSHKEPGKGNRYRVVIPYSEPVSTDKHVESTIYLNYLFGVTGVDTSSKARSRPMYFPACPSDREKYFYFYESRSKRLLDPSKQIQIPAHLKWESEQLSESGHEKVDITEDVTEGGRNDHIARVAGTLISQGKTINEVIEFCEEINELKFDPPLKSSEVARTVKSVWESHTRNNEDKDWSYDQISDRIKKIKNIDKDLDHIVEIIAVSSNRGKTSKIQAEKLIKQIKEKDKALSVTILRNMIEDTKRARINEFRESKETLDIDDTDTPVIEKIKKEFKHYFFIASENIVYHRVYETSYKLEGFNNQFSHIKQDFNDTKLSPFRILDMIGAITKVDAIRYHPAKPRIFKDHNGMTCLNSYKPSTVKPFKGNVKPLLRHFRYLFPDEYERNIVLDMIAFNYQNPGKKMKWSLIIKGKKGIGKSMIADLILSPLFGMSNVRTLNNTQPLLKEFNSWQSDAQLIVIHELFISKRLDVKQLITENIKSFITDRFLSVRKMFSDPFQQENLSNLIGFTNHEDSLFITPDERRFCMIRCEVSPRPASYYRHLAEYLEKNIESVAYYFSKRKIETIDTESLPMTNYTKEVIGTSLNWAEDIISMELQDDNSLLKKHQAFTWNGICHIVMSRIQNSGRSFEKYEDVFNPTTASGRTLRQALIEADFKQYQSGKSGRVRIDGNLERVWITPKGVRKQFHLASGGIIKKEITKCLTEAQVEFHNVSD